MTADTPKTKPLTAEELDAIKRRVSDCHSLLIHRDDILALIAEVEAARSLAVPQGGGDPDAWRKAPPHFKADERWQRLPQSDEDWDRMKDPPGLGAFPAKRRLAFASDLADPRAPSGMALVSRWDICLVLGRLTWLEARFKNTAGDVLAPPPQGGDDRGLRDGLMPFERFPELTAHMSRMGSTGAIGSLIQWDAFCRALNAALTATPAHQAQAQPGEREALGKLIHDYYSRQIGELMQQAEHWAENGKPLAVHHRLRTADAYFQIVAKFDPARRQKGWGEPFAEMAAELERPPIKPLGAYPYSAELHRYNDVNFVLAALNRTPAPQEDGVPWRPEVVAFANLMEAQLRANDYKQGWKDDRPEALWDRMRDEVTELIDATHPGSRTTVEAWRNHVGAEAADVANFAMMIADVCGALRTAQPITAPVAQGERTTEQKRLSDWIRSAMRFVDLCDADVDGYDDLHEDAEQLTADGYALFGVTDIDNACLADLEYAALRHPQ